ncbi:MAG TPA: hypothetical protein DEF00_03420 [Candidatus Taylorbacteria bacterium]|nr:MAG: hypothetical protein UY03_C0025G0006 [Parcubacteria group bacterium GW2011_GWA2_47_64]KKU96876.1 MAG: hypothetical protein UY29_C0005G0009 [Parcubacteria group bacterium GW2011_GWC2_48_17]HBV01413.1 hypothetical protein [Candidatus Taylorbacteria bacterium]
MRFRLPEHARKRMSERLVSEAMVASALENSTKIEKDSRGRLLIKMLYTRRKKERLLLLAAEWEGETLCIITIIDTTKISKYL